MDSRIDFPPPKTASSPPTVKVVLDLDPQVGVAEADLVARGGPVERGVRARSTSTIETAPFPEVRAVGLQAGDPALAAQGDRRRRSGRRRVRSGPRCPTGRRAGTRARRRGRTGAPGSRSGRCRCDPICTGRRRCSSIRRVSRSASVRSAFRAIVPGRTRTAPGASCGGAPPSVTGVVQGDELAAVGERRLDLHVVQHLRDPGHDLVGAQDVPSGLHEVDDERALTGAFDDPGGQEGDGLGVVQQHAALQAVAGDHARDRQEQLLGVGRTDVHGADTSPSSCGGLDLRGRRTGSWEESPGCGTAPAAGRTWSPTESVLRHSEQTTSSWVRQAVTSGRS